MLAIDRLIHVCHWELKGKPGRSAARELVYAQNNVELLTFLDRLALGPGSTPGLQATGPPGTRSCSARPGTR